MMIHVHIALREGLTNTPVISVSAIGVPVINKALPCFVLGLKYSVAHGADELVVISLVELGTRSVNEHSHLVHHEFEGSVIALS